MKKYLYLLCTVITLSPLHIVAAQVPQINFTYPQIPQMSQTSFSGNIPSKFTEDISNVASFIQTVPAKIIENPKTALIGVAAISTTCILAYGMCGAIQKIAQAKYEKIKKDVEEQLAAEQKPSLRNQLLIIGLWPIVGGISKYFYYNKWHMAAATIILFVGRYSGYQWQAGCGAGAVLAAGFLNQGFAENKELHAKTHEALAQLKELHAKTHEALAQLSGDLKGTKEEIMSEIARLSNGVDTVGFDVKDVGEKLQVLSTKLKDVPDQIVSLSKQAQVIQLQTGAIMGKADNLSIKVDGLVGEFVSVKKEFNSFAEKVTQQMIQTAEKTTARINEIDLNNTAHAQQTEKQINTLLEDAAAKNTLLETMQSIQKQNGEQLLNLDEQIKKIASKDTLKLESLQKIIDVQGESTINFAKEISKLNSAYDGVQSSLGTVFDQMSSMNTKITAMEEKTDRLENTLMSNHAENQQNYNALLKKYKEEKKRAKLLQKSLQELRAENAENMTTLRGDLQKALSQVNGQLRIIQGQNFVTHEIISGQQINHSFQDEDPMLPRSSNYKLFSSFIPKLPHLQTNGDELESRSSKQSLFPLSRRAIPMKNFTDD